jgi:hypothetical protein
MAHPSVPIHHTSKGWWGCVEFRSLDFYVEFRSLDFHSNSALGERSGLSPSRPCLRSRS